MRRVILALAALLAPTLPNYAGENPRPADPVAAKAALPGDAPITITINPEGRVSVTLGRVLPSPSPWGIPVEFGVRIVNQGFVTGRLEARLVGNPPADATLDFHPEPLKGVPQETRTLRITLANAAQADLTIAFRLHNEVPDLGGRDRIHLLMRAL